MNKKSRVLSNCLSSIINYKQKKTTITNKPVTVWVEPTNRCNIKCVMCPNPAIPKGDLGFMDMDLYKNIIDQVQDYAAAIELLFAGESFLHKNIFDMIEYAKSKGIQVVTSTNGTLLGLRKDDILRSGLDRLNIAFDGYNKQTFEKIRVGAKFDRVFDQTIDFLEEKKRRNLNKPFVVITTLEVGLDEYDDDDIEKQKINFYSKFKDLPIDEFIIKQPNTWGGYFKETEDFNHQKLAPTFDPCSHLWSSMSIHWDGTVVPCCFDFFNELVLGNVKEKSIDEIWNDEPIVNFRKSMLDGSYLDMNPLCEKCVIVHTGNILGIPPGMRSSIRYTLAKQLGFRVEKSLIRLAGMASSTYALRVAK
jgi:radical SAM protein with 4Fe4S-binding SPASM domain